MSDTVDYFKKINTKKTGVNAKDVLTLAYFFQATLSNAKCLVDGAEKHENSIKLGLAILAVEELGKVAIFLECLPGIFHSDKREKKVLLILDNHKKNKHATKQLSAFEHFLFNQKIFGTKIDASSTLPPIRNSSFYVDIDRGTVGSPDTFFKANKDLGETLVSYCKERIEYASDFFWLRQKSISVVVEFLVYNFFEVNGLNKNDYIEFIYFFDLSKVHDLAYFKRAVRDFVKSKSKPNLIDFKINPKDKRLQKKLRGFRSELGRMKLRRKN